MDAHTALACILLTLLLTVCVTAAMFSRQAISFSTQFLRGKSVPRHHMLQMGIFLSAIGQACQLINVLRIFLHVTTSPMLPGSGTGTVIFAYVGFLLGMAGYSLHVIAWATVGSVSYMRFAVVWAAMLATNTLAWFVIVTHGSWLLN